METEFTTARSERVDARFNDRRMPYANLAALQRFEDRNDTAEQHDIGRLRLQGNGVVPSVTRWTPRSKRFDNDRRATPFAA